MITVDTTLARIAEVQEILIGEFPELSIESADRQFDAAARICNNCGAYDPGADVPGIIAEIAAYRNALSGRLAGFQMLPSCRKLQLAVKAWKTDRLMDANT